MAATFKHIPVMLNEVVRLLSFQATPLQRLLVDCTAGGGGHAAALLLANPGSHLVGFDRDYDAVQAATSHIQRTVPLAQQRSRIVHASYVDIARHLPPPMPPATKQEGLADGILVDFGISSYQLDSAKRGFSFFDEDSLDMRFDGSAQHPQPHSTQRKAITAADIVNGLSEGELANIFKVYGEEPHAVFIARRIVAERGGSAGPINSARRLSSIIADAVSEANSAAARKGRRSDAGGGGGGSHPATRCFQALRIAVNGELDAATRLLKVAPTLLKVGGRFAAITFHSLEDRLVKNAFKALVEASSEGSAARDEDAKAAAAFGTSSSSSSAKKKRKSADDSQSPHFRFAFAEGKAFWKPSQEEVEANPRSRSATLRCIERVG